MIKAVVFGFGELFRWDMMKYAIISGLIISVVWAFVGWAVWGWLISVSSHILDMVPFSMVRSNGAWMLSSFLWLQLVLLSFALVFAFFGNIILRKVSQEKYTVFTVAVLMASAAFWAAVWFFEGNYIYHQFLKLLTWLPFETVEKGIAFLIGFYLIYNAIIVTMVFVTSMVSEPLMVKIEQRYFEHDEIRRDHLFRSLGYTVKDAVIFTILTLLAFPLLFVPVLNIIVQIALWMWLVKDTLGYDAACMVYEKVESSKLKEHKKALWFISFVTALFNFVPILNLFGPIFGESSMFYYLKHQERQ
jgi:hypothetical protein